jgi:hypothetical protein
MRARESIIDRTGRELVRRAGLPDRCGRGAFVGFFADADIFFSEIL